MVPVVTDVSDGVDAALASGCPEALIVADDSGSTVRRGDLPRCPPLFFAALMAHIPLKKAVSVTFFQTKRSAYKDDEMGELYIRRSREAADRQ